MTVRRTAGNIVKTVLFLFVFWAVFLFVIPLSLSVVEVQLGIQRFPPMPIVAGALMLASTALAVWSAMTLAIEGNGTPSAFDPPRTLVTTAPYAYLRHPFAAAATAQIVALGIAFGSIPVLAYATAAMALWYFLVRPREERALMLRFGAAAREYTRTVRGFRPHLK